MCLAIPMEVLKVEGNTAWLSAGGTKKEVRLDIVDEMPEVGDYVIVHAGFAIQKLNEEEAQKTLALFREMAALEDSN